jgi:Uma2 family endonuclease
MSAAAEMEMIPVPRVGVRFPLALPRPRGFKPADPGTWPSIPGRLEFVRGELLYMPPCGEEQSAVTSFVTTELTLWARRHPGFEVGSNEAGIHLDGDVRGADAAVWKSTGKQRTKGFGRTAPLLAVEVQGKDDTVESLREKAEWYLEHGTPTVWIVLPDSEAVLVITSTTEKRIRDRMPAPAGLAGLTPLVRDLLS